MKYHIALLTVATVLANTGGAFGGLVNMNWTAGGYTPTSPESGDVPPTAESGTIVSSVTPTTMAATLTSNPDNEELGALYFDGSPAGGSVKSDSVLLSYDIKVNNQPAAATVQPKLLNQSLNGGPAAAGTAGIMLGMNIAATVPGAPNPWAFRFALAPTSAGGGVFAMRSIDNLTLMAFGNYTVGTTYRLALAADYTTGRMDAYINGVLALNDYQFSTGGPGVSTSEVFIHLNGEDGYANSVTFNDFTVTAPVPEPSTFLVGALLALPFGLRGLRALRNRQTAA